MLDFNLNDILVEANQIRQHIGIFATTKKELDRFRAQILDICLRLNLGIWRDGSYIRLFRSKSLITLGLVDKKGAEKQFCSSKFNKVIISPEITGKVRKYIQKRAR